MAYGSVNIPGVSASELETVRALAQDAKELAESASEAITDLTNTINVVPSPSGTLTFTGSQQSPTWLNYDESKLTLGGTTQATNAGTYEATFTPKSGFKWSDDTETAKTVQWTINRGVHRNAHAERQPDLHRLPPVSYMDRLRHRQNVHQRHELRYQCGNLRRNLHAGV